MNRLHQGNHLQKRQYVLFPMIEESQTQVRADSSLCQVVRPTASTAPKVIQI
jgi:iron-sulfur cluster repair protein YtfE (RIC family)